MTAPNGVCACASLTNGNGHYSPGPFGHNETTHVATPIPRNVNPLAMVDFWPNCIDPTAALACDAIFERFE